MIDNLSTANGIGVKEVAEGNWRKFLISLLSAVICCFGHFFPYINLQTNYSAF